MKNCHLTHRATWHTHFTHIGIDPVTNILRGIFLQKRSNQLFSVFMEYIYFVTAEKSHNYGACRASSVDNQLWDACAGSN